MSLTTKKLSPSCFRPYQNDGIDFLYEHDAALALLRMGGGKTIISLTAAAELLRDGHINNVLIVAPLAVCTNTWAEEYLLWDHTCDLDVGIAVGTAGVRATVLDAEHTITVINFDVVQWFAAHYGSRVFDLVIMDEITRFNAVSGKRYKKFKPTLAAAKIRWGLTGSYGANKVIDMFNPARCVDLGAALGHTVTPFYQQYFNKGLYAWEPRVGSAEAIADRVKHLCFQPDPAVYQSQLPEIVTQQHKYEIGSPAEYEALKEDFVLGDIEVASAGVLVNKLQQVASGFIYAEFGEAQGLDTERLALLQELLAEAEGEPVLIWYWYEHTGAVLAAALGAPNLLDCLSAWNAGSVPVAICHPRSGGHGINAQAGGSRMIWYEHTWSNEERQQAIARLHRQGQKSTVFVHDIVGVVDGCAAIDAAILETQNTKGSTARDIAKRLLQKSPKRAGGSVWGQEALTHTT
jgi:hypothetical protein